MEIVNRKARFNYFILEEIEAGIALKGTEVKSLREGKGQIVESYAYIKNDEVFLINMHIAKYKEGNIFNHDETRLKKLLLHKKEILKLKDRINQEKLTLVPLKLYFKEGKAKVLLGLAKGKKLYDKRESKKEQDIKRDIAKKYRV